MGVGADNYFMKILIICILIINSIATTSAQITTTCAGCPTPITKDQIQATGLEMILRKEKIKLLHELRKKISKEVKAQAKVCTKYKGYGVRNIENLYQVLLVSYNDRIYFGSQTASEALECVQPCSLITPGISSDIKKFVEDPYFKNYLLEHYSKIESENDILTKDFKKFISDENH